MGYLNARWDTDAPLAPMWAREYARRTARQARRRRVWLAAAIYAAYAAAVLATGYLLANFGG